MLKSYLIFDEYLLGLYAVPLCLKLDILIFFHTSAELLWYLFHIMHKQSSSLQIKHSENQKLL